MPHHRTEPATRGHTIGWWAPFYDALAWLGSLGSVSAIRRTTIRLANLQTGESVLDVGCGTGSLTRLAARQVAPGGRVVGVDASKQMIGTARRKASREPAVDFQVAPIEKLPVADDEFDVAFSSLMLHHLPGDLKARGLAEVRRVLKPSGRLIVVDLDGSRGLLGRLPAHRLPADY